MKWWIFLWPKFQNNRGCSVSVYMFTLVLQKCNVMTFACTHRIYCLFIYKNSAMTLNSFLKRKMLKKVPVIPQPNFFFFYLDLTLLSIKIWFENTKIKTNQLKRKRKKQNLHCHSYQPLDSIALLYLIF